MSAITRDYGDSCGLLPVSLSQRPTPHERFIENKSQTAIRPNGDRTVESRFFRFSGLQSRSISALFFSFNCPVGRGSQLDPTIAQSWAEELSHTPRAKAKN
jgi:hypothetical protein